MHHSDELIALIDNRLVDARREVARLEAARHAMQTQKPASRDVAVRGRRRASNPARRSGKAAARTPAVPADGLERLLTGGDGASTADLARRLRADRAHVLALLRQMETQGQVRRTEERRVTRWHWVTDEDRVAARAAELARRSRRRR